jgi:hemolysin activation/secretion protein
VRQGVPAFGASRLDDPFTSRWSPADFAVLEFNAARVQSIVDGWSVKLSGAAQWASAPLFTSQQFFVGGASFGRGYDAALIGGDNGLGGSAELRFDPRLAWSHLKGLELYIFADGGRVWDLHSNLGAQWLISAGGGVRAYFGHGWEGGLGAAFPLDADVFDRPAMGPRLLFSLSKKLKVCPVGPEIWCG